MTVLESEPMSLREKSVFVRKNLDEVFNSLMVIGFKMILKNYLRPQYLTIENLARLGEILVYEKYLGLTKLGFKGYLEENGVLGLVKRKNVTKMAAVGEKLSPLAAK
jgi:hypothetical protein